MEYDTINVNTPSGSYPIYLGDNLLKNLVNLLHTPNKRKAIIISDNNVSIHYGAIVRNALSDAGWSIDDILVVPAGESSKSFNIVEDLASKILSHKIDRQTMIFALGGGVVGDLSGFLASILLRGIEFVQIPTSLLAQVDSSVGGKTGINVSTGKNLIGSFYQPSSVIIDTSTLKTLPIRELKSGYAEIIKYGIMYDIDFWQWLQENGSKVLDNDTEALKYAILRSCEIKAEIVAKDEKETSNLRALLNFGHSFGHALEYLAGYNDVLKHGEAVAIGMVMAAKFSEKMKICPLGVARDIENHLNSLDISTEIPFKLKPEDIINAMKFDKKNKNDMINLVLLEDIGIAVVKNNIDAENLALFLKGII